ncbi:MAG TPA: prepilin-type N-terminal cleavage/methylation domain-containing protein [Phycisphaerae bacterium]|nr:prepilin-type N-terminal cleavage/methylation domain-containing protein [Phycisphaerae bacterium]HNU43817.1 prepilin-type N-terminal cleavage/methylation domain-containing protein [Phycisphaerae bacterium]
MSVHTSGPGSRAGCHRLCGGFTLVELLVVIAILALLISILLPSMNKARQHARAVVCLSRCRDLGRGMLLYLNDFKHFPAHQVRVNDPADTRIRWFNAMAYLLDGYEVQSCPSTPDWVVGRNNSYGYNYKYLGSLRDNTDTRNPRPPYERFPVRDVRMPQMTIAFADCDGTGWKLDYVPKPLNDGQDALRFGNHGYTLDPTYIPVWSERTLSGGAPEPYAYLNWRSYLSDRHLGRAAAIFVDGHGERVDPREVYRDNRMWNGLGFDAGQDPNNPLYRADPHVDYKWDPGSGQEWRYP